jgi:hypothetical protein
MLKIMNMAMVRIIGVISGKFDIVGICTTENKAQKWELNCV